MEVTFLQVDGTYSSKLVVAAVHRHFVCNILIDCDYYAHRRFEVPMDLANWFLGENAPGKLFFVTWSPPTPSNQGAC